MILWDLYEARDRWITPQLLGGRDGSHHAGTLRQLRGRGLVERLKWCRRHGQSTTRECACKGSCRYRITAEGAVVARKLGGAVMGPRSSHAPAR